MQPMLPCNDSLLFVSGHRKNAEDAMQSLNGAVIGKQTVRLSWGRSPASKQVILLNIVRVFFIGWIISWLVDISQYDSICILQIPPTPNSLSLSSFSSGTEIYSFFFLTLGSGEITVTSGMGHIMEAKAMVGMDMLCHRLRV